MAITVTGASGRLGRRVAELLLANRSDPPGALGEPAEDVVLVTRRPAALADLAARGAIVRAGDFDDPAGLVEAFAGTERLLLVSTDALDRRVIQHRRAIEAAVRAGVEDVVYTSLSNPAPGNPVGAVTDAHRRTEDVLVALAPRWTILRNATYADALLPLWLDAAAAGRLVTSQGDGCTAWVGRDDCAAVAAAVLADRRPERHAGRIYDVTGPSLVGAADLAGALAEWADHSVNVEHVDDDTMVAHLVAAGLPADRAHLVATWHRAIREGWFTQCTDLVETLAGHPARTVTDLLTGSTS
jgi:NAD(P)H dehydrogenase (quinone)